MRTIPLFVGIFCLCFFAACVSKNPYGFRTTRAGPTEIYTNQPSHFCFPPRIDNFVRQQVTDYDREGRDVGVDYLDPARGVLVTVFVYPKPQRPPDDTLSGHFASCKEMVLSQHSGATIESEGAIQISPDAIPRDGQHAAFSYMQVFAKKWQPVRSELFLFTHNDRFLMFRATYPRGETVIAGKVTLKFVNDLAWPLN